MLIRLDAARRTPLNRQVYERLRHAILAGEVAPARRLPPSRELARDLGVSRNVVVAAYEQLVAEGYLESRVGAGTFVAALPPALESVAADGRDVETGMADAPRLASFAERALAQRPFSAPRAEGTEPRYDFRYSGGRPDAAGLKTWRRLVVRHADQLAHDYGPTAGHPSLRREIATYLRGQRGVHCGPRQVIVVNGSQQGLDLACRVLLEPGDRVLIEDPHYQGARKAFLAAGAELVPVPVDDEGLDVAAARPADARLAYVTPSHQFPTGAVMSLRRRLALLGWAARHGAYVLEDDYDSEFRYEGRPVEAVQGLDRHSRTIYVGTLSKVLSPTLRLGYLVVPEALIEAFEAVKWLCDRHTPTLEQAALADFMAEGHFERHLRRMRTRNARRREVLLAALAEHLGERVRVTGTNAGVHLLAWLPGVPPARLGRLIETAAALDVGLYSCAPYFLQPPPAAGLLMGYAALSPEEIREGIRRLGRILAGSEPG